MAKSKRNPSGIRQQVIMSAPKKLLVERYLTKKGKRLLALTKTKKEKVEIWKKYGKNRYRNNPNAKPLFTVNHNDYHYGTVSVLPTISSGK